MSASSELCQFCQRPIGSGGQDDDAEARCFAATFDPDLQIDCLLRAVGNRDREIEALKGRPAALTITVRDMFATQAMGGLLADSARTGSKEEIAARAVALADALMKALDEVTP